MNYIAAWTRDFEIIEPGMEIGCWDNPDDITSEWSIGPWHGRYNFK